MINEILKRFDEQFPPFAQVDEENIFIDRKGFPVLLNEAVKSFIRSSCIELVESLRMEEMKYTLNSDRHFKKVGGYNLAISELNKKIDALKT